MSVKRVKLKENSPEFVDEKRRVPGVRHCEMPGCKAEGEFRAPKDRSLSDYYHFCAEHVREYNAAWDFFEGMSQSDIEAHMRQSMFGDRPTWVYTSAPGWEDTLREKASSFRGFDDEPPKARRERTQTQGTPETEALTIMGLEPPVSFDKIKERYRTLMKTYHPDRNPGDAEAEELVKRVNMAYTILRAAHERYEETVKV